MDPILLEIISAIALVPAAIMALPFITLTAGALLALGD